MAEPDYDLFNFGPLFLCFKNWILAYIITTTLIYRKGSLSSIFSRNVYVLYCFLSKYHVNWASWFKKYMMENVEDSNSTASLPSGLLISQILVDCPIDLFSFKPSSSLYDLWLPTFSSVGYVQVWEWWFNKDSVIASEDSVKVTRISSDFATLLLKDINELKNRLLVVESGLEVLQDALEKILHLHKDARMWVKFTLPWIGWSRMESLQWKN